MLLANVRARLREASNENSSLAYLAYAAPALAKLTTGYIQRDVSDPFGQ
jgi:hypothetical protein